MWCMSTSIFRPPRYAGAVPVRKRSSGVRSLRRLFALRRCKARDQVLQAADKEVGFAVALKE